MKILFAIKAMNDMKGGAERVLADVTSALSDNGNDISILTFDRPGGSSFYPLNKKVKRICLGIGDTHHKSTWAETHIRMRALRSTVKKEKPDIIVAFMHSMFVPMAFAMIGTGIPVIASEHIVPEYYKTRRLEFILLLFSSLFVRRITVLSEPVKASYPRFLHKKMVTISNPVLKPKLMADPEGKDTARKIILNVGRLDPQKDQEILIKAFAKLAPDYPDWDVRIMGDGELRDKLENTIKEYGLENRIFLPGTTPNISEEYQKAHIFAMPSIYESFGLATAEALAHSLPAIGFADCPGTNELIINNNNGLLIEGKNKEISLARALKKLMDSPKLRAQMGQNARNSAKSLRPEIIFQKWENLIKDEI